MANTRYVPWTTDEKKSLLVYYPRYRKGALNKRELMNRFPGRKFGTLASMHSYLNTGGRSLEAGVRAALWSDEEITKLRSLWPMYRAGDIDTERLTSSFPGRSMSGIQFKAYDLKLSTGLNLSSDAWKKDGQLEAAKAAMTLRGNPQETPVKELNVYEFETPLRSVALRLKAMGWNVQQIRDVLKGRALHVTELAEAARVYAAHGRVVIEEVEGVAKIRSN